VVTYLQPLPGNTLNGVTAWILIGKGYVEIPACICGRDILDAMVIRLYGEKIA
jgi:hypothetical protein